MRNIQSKSRSRSWSNQEYVARSIEGIYNWGWSRSLGVSFSWSIRSLSSSWSQKMPWFN